MEMIYFLGVMIQLLSMVMVAFKKSIYLLVELINALLEMCGVMILRLIFNLVKKPFLLLIFLVEVGEKVFLFLIFLVEVLNPLENILRIFPDTGERIFYCLVKFSQPFFSWPHGIKKTKEVYKFFGTITEKMGLFWEYVGSILGMFFYA